MNTIVVIAEHQDEFTMFSSNFSHLPIHFSWNKSIQTALEKLPLEQPFILFAVSKNIEQLTGWLRVYDASRFQIPLVAFTSALGWSERELLWKTGVSDVVELPRSRKELEFIIRAFLIHPQVLEISAVNQMHGQLQDLNVIDLLRSYGQGKKSGILLLEKGSAKGQLEFQNGRLVNATLAECDPLEAVMVMSLWKDGVFYGRFDTQKHKETILLDNDQVVIECRNYQKAYAGYMKKLPDWDEVLFTDPDLEYQEFGPKDREVLQKFRNGLTLNNLMQHFEGNWNFLLKKIILWVDRKWLLREEAYRLFQARLKADERKSPLRKVFEKVFSKNGADDGPAEEVAEGNNPDDPFDMAIEKKGTLFNQGQTLVQFESAQEAFLEVAVIVADNNEEELLFGNDAFETLESLSDTKISEIHFSPTKSVLCYCVNNLERSQAWTQYDQIFTKIPFLLVLFQRENGNVVALINQLQQRYDIPIYLLTSKSVAEDVDIQIAKNLQSLSEKPLIQYDSLAEDKMQQVFLKALKLFLNN